MALSSGGPTIPRPLAIAGVGVGLAVLCNGVFVPRLHPPWRIHGTVIGRSGERPVAQCAVRVSVCTTPRLPDSSQTVNVFRTDTDSRGRFRLSIWRGEYYAVIAALDGAANVVGEAIVTAHGPQAFDRLWEILPANCLLRKPESVAHQVFPVGEPVTIRIHD